MLLLVNVRPEFEVQDDAAFTSELGGAILRSVVGPYDNYTRDYL